MSGVNLPSRFRHSAKRNYSSLIRELAITEFKLKYQGSVFAYFWSLMKPLAIFAVLYLVFTVFVKIPSNVPHYPVYLLLGILLWNYFAESTSSAMRAVVDKGDLIRKVYFPRIVIIIASSISALITLTLNLLIIFVFIAFSGIHLGVTALLFPLLIIELWLLTLGISLFLSALYVKFRDFAYIWEVALQLLFYASAIIFPLEIVPHRFIKFISLSPITQIVQDSREVLISSVTLSTVDILNGALLFIPYLIPPILVILGYWYFDKTAAGFAEEI